MTAAILIEQDLVEPCVVAETAQVHIGFYAWQDAVLAILPDGVFSLPVDDRPLVGISAYVEGIFVEMWCQVFVVELHGGVNHGLGAEVLLNELCHLCNTVDELAARPVSPGLYIEHGDEVLAGKQCAVGEVFELLLHCGSGGEVVVTAHEQPIVMCHGQVEAVMG